MRVIEPARGVGALDDIVGGTIKPAALLFGGAVMAVIAIINEVLTPTEEEVAKARQVVIVNRQGATVIAYWFAVHDR